MKVVCHVIIGNMAHATETKRVSALAGCVHLMLRADAEVSRRPFGRLD